MKFATVLIFLILASLLLMMEWSFLAALVTGGHVLLFLPISMLLISGNHVRASLALGALGAYAHDFFSPLMFGVFMSAYVVTLAFTWTLFQKWFPVTSKLSVLTVGFLGLMVFYSTVFLVDTLFAVLFPPSVHIGITDPETLAKTIQSIWTSMLAMTIIVALGGVLSHQIQRRLRVKL